MHLLEKGGLSLETITQMKSWLNVELSSGCPYSCAYCFRHSDGDFSIKKPMPTAPVDEIFQQLLKHTFFIPDKTHVSVSGSKSDAFLAQNKSRTFEFLELLDKQGFKNWVTIVTKAEITRDDARILKNFPSITPVVFVTYSEMPSSIESIPNEQRISSMKALSEAGVRTVLYWRPLIEGFNTSDEQIEKVLEAGEKYACAFVLSGLRATPEIKRHFESIGLQLPAENWDPEHKIISKIVKQRIFQKYEAKKCEKPLFLKSSCAVSCFEGLPDFNAHWSKPEKNCSPFCPKAQKERCFLQSKKEIPKEITEALPKLSREEKTFYRHIYRLPIK